MHRRPLGRAAGRTGSGRNAAGRRAAGWSALSAVLVALLSLVIAARGDPVRGAVVGVLDLAAIAAVLVLRRRAPGPGAAVAGALSIAAATLTTTAPVQTMQPLPPFALAPLAIGVVIAVVAGAWRWAIVSVGVGYAAALTVVFVSDSTVLAARGVGTMTLLLVALGVGGVARSRGTRRAEEARLREAAQHAAVEAERLRIARELHDVLAHSLSSISVQAGVGLHLAANRPAAATEALATIRAVSGAALDEVRGVLGVLRGDEEAPMTPGPDLDAIAGLVEEARRSGARIRLDDTLDPRPAAPVQAALFRIAQEGLTNARRHAPGAAVEIALRRHGEASVVRIRDHAGIRPADPVAGNGIAGMRERTAAFGGRLDLVLHDDGFEVVALIPSPHAADSDDDGIRAPSAPISDAPAVGGNG